MQIDICFRTHKMVWVKTRESICSKRNRKRESSNLSTSKYQVVRSITFRRVVMDDVRRAIASISSMAKGLDGVSIQIADSPMFTRYLAILFNSSMSDCCIPEQLKTVKVTPVPKIPRPIAMKDYRPVAVSSVIIKILEKVIYEQLEDHLDRLEFFGQRQYGFRRHVARTWRFSTWWREWERVSTTTC